MKTRQAFAHVALSALLVSCATPGPPPRARVAVELLQGFPPSLETRAGAPGPREEHVVLLVDATASMQEEDEGSLETKARAATVAAARLSDSLAKGYSVDAWTLGASEAECAPASRGMPFDDPEQLAPAGEGSLADALETIATRLEAERFAGQEGDLASRSERLVRVAVFTDLRDECGGDLCSAASHLVDVGARLELTLFGDESVPRCLAELELGESYLPPMQVEDRRPGPARFWVEPVEEGGQGGEAILAAGRTDGASRTLLAGRAYVHVELDQTTRFGPVDLTPGTETRLRILDFPGLVPAVREWSWHTREISPTPGPPAINAP